MDKPNKCGICGADMEAAENAATYAVDATASSICGVDPIQMQLKILRYGFKLLKIKVRGGQA